MDSSTSRKIQKITTPLVRLPRLRSFSIIGDPGCEGLGTCNMNVYAGALTAAAVDDITLIVGDLVPTSHPKYYETINSFTETIAQKPVYVLRGNHDTGAYTTYYGLHNYALLADGFALIVLDNAMRKFEPEGLELVAEVLAKEEVTQAVLAFHIPVPNHFIPNSVSETEQARLQAAYAPWKEKVKYLVCGHVHSRFVDKIDDIPLICSGGGGAMIEDVSPEIRACDVNHHLAHFSVEANRIRWEWQDLPDGCYAEERKNAILREQLEQTVSGEMMAHLKYLTYADQAQKRGMDTIANLFRALAESEYHHARNFYAVLEQPAPFADALPTFIEREAFEHTTLYRMLADYAAAHHAPLSMQSYQAAAAAEQVHATLLQEAIHGIDSNLFACSAVYVCPICGHVMIANEASGESVPNRCPVCGGPARQFHTFAVG